MSDQLELLSWENCKKNRPAFRHEFQDKAEDFTPDRHEFIRRVDVEGAYPINYESHATGRIRISADSQIHKDILPAEVAGNIDDSQRVWRLHGEAGFFVN